MSAPTRRLSVLALLAGCAAAHAPPGPGPSPPALVAAEFVAADGTRLALRSWLPAGAPKAVIVALHGFNDYGRAFDTAPDAPGTGSFLAARGIAVYAYDQRGFGRSSYAGVWAGHDKLIDDLRAFVDVVQLRHSGVPVYALGESMGGAVVMTAMAGENPPRVDSVILVAPAVWARSTMPWFYRTAMWLGARMVPSMKPSGRGFGRQASNNIEMLRQNAVDPLFIKNTRIDAIAGLTDLMDAALLSPPRLAVPVFYLYGARDEIIPKAPSLAAMRALPAGARTAYYPAAWHMMLRDKMLPDKGGQVPLADIAAFVADPTAALPSGADVDAMKRLGAAIGK